MAMKFPPHYGCLPPLSNLRTEALKWEQPQTLIPSPFRRAGYTSRGAAESSCNVSAGPWYAAVAARQEHILRSYDTQACVSADV